MPIRLKAKNRRGFLTVQIMISNHKYVGPMKKDPASDKTLVYDTFIKVVKIKVVDQETEIHASNMVSSNPKFTLKYPEIEKGNNVEVTWVDNKGNTETKVARV